MDIGDMSKIAKYLILAHGNSTERDVRRYIKLALIWLRPEYKNEMQAVVDKMTSIIDE